MQLLGLPLWDERALPEFLVGLEPKLVAWTESAKLSDVEREDFMAQVAHYEAMVVGKGFDYAGVRERAERWLAALEIDGTRLGLPSLGGFAAMAAGVSVHGPPLPILTLLLSKPTRCVPRETRHPQVGFQRAGTRCSRFCWCNACSDDPHP